ncbi:MAG TPA: SUMF1/EgtB/PvdO family nonheme iron enzyme [Armatimonadota bacterium]|nr:SUMF1/EgtB/PvdO family nonheme iron enzyme [Armatimonadota bacterium]
MFGTDDGTLSVKKANYNGTGEHPVPVRSYPSNPYGLYDLSGNVGEWCLDWFGSYAPDDPQYMFGIPKNTYRVIRGGSWNLFAFHCRAAYRNFDLPFGAADYLGFRVVRRSSSGQ